jgi:trimethylamine:corrinoid methyltransferase-like protein
MWQGIRVDADTLALDLAHAVGPRGNYLAQVHTARHCRDQLWPARYLGQHIPLSMGLKPDLELAERIDAQLRSIVAEHRPTPPAPALVAALDEIQTRFELEHPPRTTGLGQPCRS